MRQRLVLAALCLALLGTGACNRTEAVDAPSDWTAYTGRSEDLPLTVWVPSDVSSGSAWYSGAMNGYSMDFEVASREGNAFAQVSLCSASPWACTECEVESAEDALECEVKAIEEFYTEFEISRVEGFEITSSRVYDNGDKGKILAVEYNANWESEACSGPCSIELTTHGTSRVHLRYWGDHRHTERERDELLTILRNMQVSD
ncbi:MAG: hypothetical protein GX620_07425 [Chloroflexi bacterium]|jgi:hypothetical protein|nr:hypothetical protein [Chloroflexota bacterium]